MRIFPLIMFLPCGALCLNMYNKLETTFQIFGNEISVAERFATRVDEDDIPNPPPHKQTAKMSRYLVHYSDWLALATESTRAGLQGTPFASIFSFSDGPKKNSTGVPYFYLTGMDMSTKDLLKNPKTSATMSLAQGNYCAAKKLDPEDPRCAHVILAGEMVRIQAGSNEEQFAKQALFTRHPVMADWPVNHEWFFAKINISNVILLDFFGGAIDVPLQDYFNAQP